MTSKLIPKKFGIAILLFLIGLPYSAYSQKRYSEEEIDTCKIKPLNKETLHAFKEILLVNDLKFGWTKYYALNAYHLVFNKEQDSAIAYAKMAIENYEKVKEEYLFEETNLVNAYFAMGRAYHDKNEYQKSTISLLKCLDVEKRHRTKARGYITSGIANNHLALGNDSLAVIYYKEVLKDSFYVANKRSMATAQMRIGVLYGEHYLNKLDSSKQYLHRAVKSSLNSRYKNNLSAMYGNLGDVYKKEGKLDSTLFYYKKAYDTLQVHKPITKEGLRKTPMYNIVNYSYVKIHSGKLNEAIKDLNGILDSLKLFSGYSKNDRGLFISTYDNLIFAFQKKGNYRKIEEIQELKESFLDQFHKKQLKQELEKLHVQYATREKELEIERLGILTKDQTIIQRQQNIIFSSVIILLLICVAGIAFFYYQKNLNDKYKKVVIQQQLLRTQMNPHFIFNALNKIIVLHKDVPNIVKEYVLRLSKFMRLALENSREEFVPLEKEVEALENYLILQSNFSKNFTFDIAMDPDIEPEFNLIPPMMVQPFVENSIIHGIAAKGSLGEIKIAFALNTEKTLTCTIMDNGVGFQSDEKSIISTHDSLSEKIVKERLAIYSKILKSKTSLNIQSLKDENGENIGTKVSIVLPVNVI